MENFKGVGYLKSKLSNRRDNVLKRYSYYEMKDQARDIGITIPSEFKHYYRSTLGWCAKAVDSLADRLTFNKFTDDYFDFNGIYAMNNPDVIFDSAILSALISSCSFIYIAPDEETGTPQMQVIDGGNATGIIDPVTGLMTEGYAVLKRGDNDEVIQEAYFVPGKTEYRDVNGTQTIYHSSPAAALVPIIYRPDAKRPFGHSRISRACMYYQNYAKRVLVRSDVSAEFYSIPQRYVLGLDQNAELMDQYRALITNMLQFDKDEAGDHPVVGQFQQQSMSPYTEQFKTAAAGFAGETGLTLDDLGFATANPSSSEAIKASHEILRLTARKAQRSFGSGFLNAGYVAACIRDGKEYRRNEIYLTTPKWKPIFEADFAALSGAGDSLIKIQQAFPGYLTEEKLEELLGI